jgi:hypothetical protein
MSVLGTYQGASTIMRKAFVWNLSRISVLEVEAYAHLQILHYHSL